VRLSVEEREAFIWSWSNDRTTTCGVYRPGYKVRSAVAGYDVEAALRRVQKASHKIVVYPDGLLWVVDFVDHQIAGGTRLVGAVNALFRETTSPAVVFPWLAVNRNILRMSIDAKRTLEQYGWSVDGRQISSEDDDIAWLVPDGATVKDLLAMVPAYGQAALDVGEPVAKEEKPKADGWSKDLTAEQGRAVFEYWCERFDKNDRTKFTEDRAKKIRARAREGLTFVEAKLAVLGCYKVAQTQLLSDGKSRFSVPATHDFTLIFRSDTYTRRFIDTAEKYIRAAGKRISDDGTRIVDIGG